jgi:hypothetical protein
MATITSATAVYMLSISSVFPTPQKIDQFGVDEAFDTDMADTAEVRLGVDGVAVSGWIPRLTKQTITLLASSESFVIFENWVAAQDIIKEVLYATGLIQIPGIKRQYVLPQGTLTRYPAMPNAKRVLADRRFEITWSWPITGAPL